MEKKYERAYVLAARVYCHYKAHNKIVDPDLVEVIAEIIYHASTEELIEKAIKNPPQSVELLDMDIVGSSADRFGK